jgi:PLP dependent protein
VLTESVRQRLTENWQSTVAQVAAAAVAAGRSRDSVRIIGVSKYVNADITQGLLDAGCRDLGEARPQQLIEKVAAIASESVTWHLIGHLQRNKAKRVVEVADVIHSVDSLTLLESIANHAAQANRVPKLLIEVNISGEHDKHGIMPSELPAIWPTVMKIENVAIVGLMAMAGLESRGETASAQFAAVRELRDSLEAEFGSKLPELSMGMSGDFVEAIGAGATMVRIGSHLFTGID